MRYLYAIIILMLAGCTAKEVDQSELVANAARQYYDYLLDGDYEAFVDGCYQEDSIRSFYRLQLVENAKMFVAQQQTEHKGISKMDVGEVELDTARHIANVFLVLHYGDSTQQRILLPMVEHDGLWYMR